MVRALRDYIGYEKESPENKIPMTLFVLFVIWIRDLDGNYRSTFSVRIKARISDGIQLKSLSIRIFTDIPDRMLIFLNLSDFLATFRIEAGLKLNLSGFDGEAVQIFKGPLFSYDQLVMLFRKLGQILRSVFGDEYAVADLCTVVVRVRTAVDGKYHAFFNDRLAAFGKFRRCSV